MGKVVEPPEEQLIEMPPPKQMKSVNISEIKIDIEEDVEDAEDADEFD